MIVLLDIDRQTVSLYTKEGQTDISFKDAYKLYNYLEDENVYYITNAVEANAEDIINVIKGMGVHVDIPVEVQETGRKYIHTPKEGTIWINENIKFQGKYDIKIYDEEMHKTVSDNLVLQQLIKNKTVEIIGEGRRHRILDQFKGEIERKEVIKQAEDRKLDSMLVDQGVSISEMAKQGSITIDDNETGSSDVISIDIDAGATRKLSGDKEFETMSDLMKVMNSPK